METETWMVFLGFLGRFRDAFRSLEPLKSMQIPGRVVQNQESHLFGYVSKNVTKRRPKGAKMEPIGATQGPRYGLTRPRDTIWRVHHRFLRIFDGEIGRHKARVGDEIAADDLDYWC